MNRSFSLLRRNLGLILVPVIMDIIAFFTGLLAVGFFGEPSFQLKLFLTVGVPSIGDILENNFLAGGNINLTGTPEAAGIAVLLFLIFLVLSAFIEAGFIGLLYETARNEVSPSVSNFAGYAKRFGLRFLGLRLLIFIVTLVGFVFGLLLFFVGVIAFMIIFIILRIKYIYWEFTIVAEDLGILEAFQRSRELYDQRSPELANIIIKILAANFLFGLALNFLWMPIILFIGIFLYAYVATGLQLELMLSLPGLKNEPQPPLEAY